MNNELCVLQKALALFIFSKLKYFIIFVGYSSNDNEPDSGINTYNPKLSDFGCKIFLYD